MTIIRQRKNQNSIHLIHGTVIFFLAIKNKSIAESQTVSKMGTNFLNDKSDAFRQTFFQAINTMAVGASLTQQFAMHTKVKRQVNY